MARKKIVLTTNAPHQQRLSFVSSRVLYTKEEDDLIIKHYEDSGSKQLVSLLPNRSKQSIIARARLLGFNCQVNKNYSDEENKLIMEFYPTGGVEQLFKLLTRRSPQSIHSQASRLGIKVSDELKIQLRNKNFRKSYKGTENIPGQYFSRLRTKSKERNMAYNVSNQYLEDLMKAQDFKCALSGVEISFPERKRGERQNFSASLDRIDSSKSYEEGNVQWVHKDVNIMKNDLDQDRFIDYCKKIAANK